jgi:hypothetical protein
MTEKLNSIWINFPNPETLDEYPRKISPVSPPTPAASYALWKASLPLTAVIKPTPRSSMKNWERNKPKNVHQNTLAGLPELG